MARLEAICVAVISMADTVRCRLVPPFWSRFLENYWQAYVHDVLISKYIVLISGTNLI
jgi:hypothetical protein